MSDTADTSFILYGQSFHSRLLLGTSRYPSPAILEAAVRRAQPAMVTASLRRQGSNTARCRTPGPAFGNCSSNSIAGAAQHRWLQACREAITTAQMAREVFETPWIARTDWRRLHPATRHAQPGASG